MCKIFEINCVTKHDTKLCVCEQVNGLDTVRVPVSVGPFVEQSKKKLLNLEAEAAENKPESEPE